MNSMLLSATFTLALSSCVSAQVNASDPPSRPAIKMLRWTEDWSALRDPSLRTSFFDPIKYIPLNDSGETFLTVAGTVRLRYQRFENNAFGAGPQDNSGFLLQRYMLGADLRFSENLRAFGEVKSILESGRNGGPRPTDEDEFDIHQLFGDVRLPISDASSATIRPGRQELAFGSARLIGVRDGPNNRLAFDAVRATITLESGWTIDALLAQPVEDDPGVLDNQRDEDRTLWGVYATSSIDALVPGASLDAYYLGYREDDARYERGVGDERRHSFGARLFGKRGAVDYNAETVLQIGSFGDDDIFAWTIGTDTGYTLSEGGWRPRLASKLNIISGDSDTQDGTLGSFNAMFPRGAYFGDIGILGPRNLITIEPYLELRPHERITITASVNVFWRYSDDDAIYNAGGGIVRSDNASDARFIGWQPSLEARWRINEYALLSIQGAAFLAGDFIEDTGPSEDVQFVEVTLEIKF